MSAESKTELAKYYAKLALVAVNAGATKIAQVTDALIASGLTKTDAENAAAAALAAKGVADGGCSCKLGGVDEYSSPTRDAFVKEMLKFAESEGTKLSGSTTEERLKSYLDTLTNYSAPGADVRCRKLAEKINGFYGDVIDTKAPVKEICEQIAEVMAAFRSGMHAEFLGVYSDVRSVLHNMMVLDKWLDERISELSSDVSGSNAPPKAANNMELIKMLSAEIKRHIFMLNGLMKSGLEQTAGLLDAATAKPGVLMQHIKRLESSGGDTKNLRTIELNLRRGVAVNAYMAEHIKQALAKVGMTVAEFKAADTVQKLNEALLKGLLGKDDPSAMAAAQEILDRFVDREKLLEIMGAAQRHGGAEFSDDFGEYDKNGYPKSNIERRQESQKRLRKLVLTVFNRAVNERFNMFVDALNRLAARVGKEIPPGDSLKEFTETLGRINGDMTHKKYLYHALIGYYNDAMSKSVKDSFVANLNMVSRAVDGLLALPEYAAGAQYLRDVKDAISGVVSVIDKYSDEVAQKFGAAEVSGGYHMSPSSVQTIPLFSTLFLGAAENRGSDDDEVINVGGASGGAYDAIADTYGGCCGATGGAYDAIADTYGGAYDASDIYGGAADDGDLHDKYAQYRPPKGVSDAITAFTFLTRAETIKKNLAAMSGDTASYGKGQTDLNAQSIVEILSKSQKEYIAMRDYLKTQQGPLAAVVGNATAAEKLVTQAQSFLDEQWNARKNFWATVESMDECMRQFTDTITSSPDKVKEIDQLLDSVEIISDWYSSKAGNTLAEIFEKFPDALPAANAATALGPYAATPIANSADHYYKIISAGGHGAVGNPYIHTTMDAAKEVSESLKKFFMLMTALKNLFSVFVHFGHAVGGDALAKSAMMPPNRMYQNIVTYLRASSLSQGFLPAGQQLLADDEKSLRPAFTAGLATSERITTGNLNGTAYGSHIGGGANALDDFRRMYGISMRSVNGEIKAVDAVKFDLEDQYFIHMIKAAAAKVLTVTGTYGLFSRPASYVDGQQRLAPIRMILGGGSDIPEVIPEATALYLRLPLLLQWYRRLFDGEDANKFAQYNSIPLSKGGRSLKVSLIPDIDGAFAPLIKLIFTDLRAVDTAAYTDEDLRRIVREVNGVWQRNSSKHAGNPVRGIIHDLVNEINRRYGIVNKDDYDLARQEGERGYRYRDISKNYADEFDTDLAILPGEDGDLPSRLTPSQRLMNSDVELTKTIRKSKYTVTADHYKIVKDFRCAIDKLLEGDGNAYQFTETIATVQNELKTIAGADKRFEVVATLMRGTDLRARVDGFKYVLFNETVVASLNLLSGIHTILKHYQARMLVCNYNKIVEYVAALHTAAGGAPASMDALRLAVDGQFVIDYPWLGTDNAPKTALYRAFGGTGAIGTGYPAANAGAPDRYLYLRGLLNGLSADDIVKFAKAKAAPAGKSDEWQRVQAFFSGLLSRKNIMLEIIDAVYSVCDGAHATASMSDGRMTVAYGGLEEMVRDTFASAFYFMSLLRPKIEKALYDQWTDKLRNGSYYWLQEQLMEKIIIGRRKGATADDREYPNLEVISRGVSDTWMWIAKEHYDADMAGANPAVSANVAKDQFGDTFAEAIFYDASVANSGIQGSIVSVAGDDAKLLDYRVDPYEELVVGGPSDKRVLDTRFAARFKQLYTWGKEFTNNRSLLFDFNQIVAKFIQSFYDVNSKKIFTGLIDKLANSAFASAVADPVNYTYPDVVPAVQIKFGAQTKREMPQSVVLAAGLNPGRLAAVEGWLTTALAAAPANYIDDAGAAMLAAGTTPGFAAAVGNVVQLLVDILRVIQAVPADVGANVLAGGLLAGASAVTTGFWNGTIAGIIAFIPAIMRQFPFAKDIGPAGSPERADRIRLLATMIVWCAANPAANAVVMSEELAKAMKAATYAVPVDARGSAHKWLVSAEDMATMDESNPAADSVSNGGSTDKSVLLYARSAPIRGYPGGSTYVGIGGKAAPGGLAPQLKFGQRKDPDADHVLFTSLAVTLRTLVSTKTAGTSAVNVYLADTVADLPQHMKEKYRANLPAFKTLLGALVQRCEFYKMLLSRGGVDLGRVPMGAAINVWPFTLVDPVADSQKNMTRFGGIIDAITRGCTAMIQSIDQTLREVGDDPMYLEIAQGSIRDYTTQNGVAPFMPLSSTLVALKDVDLDLFPVHQTGDSEFKIMYGTRGMLHGLKPTQENTPGLAKIVQLYNGGVGTQYMADIAAAQQFLERYVRALRWIYGVRNVRGMLTHQFSSTLSRYNVVKAAAPVGPAGATTNNTDYQSIINAAAWTGKPVWSIVHTVDDTIRLTESSMYTERVTEFIDYVFQRPATSPPDLAVQNILDLDIVPINVHALRREIPFADLLNYSYTFDRMIIELYYGHIGANSDEKNVVKLIRELCSDQDPASIRSAKDMLVSLLISPHQDFGKDITVYSRLLRHLEGMLRGTVTIDGLSRPRFLSDEVFGKAVFGEVYCEPGYYNEMGPGAGHVASTKYHRDAVVAQIVQVVTGLFAADCQGVAGGSLPMCADVRGGGPATAALEKLVRAAVRYSYDNADASPVDDVVAVIDKYGLAAAVHAAAAPATPAEKKLLAKAVSLISYACVDRYVDKDTYAAGAKPDIATRVGTKLTGAAIGLAGDAVAVGALDAIAAAAGDQTHGISAPDMTHHAAGQLHYLASGKDLPAGLSGATFQPDNQNVMDANQVQTVAVAVADLGRAGAQRFDTVLVRNLVFIINMLRSVRLQLTRDLFYGQGSVVSANANIDPRITEMYGNAVNRK